jgi:hypothetical protein
MRRLSLPVSGVEYAFRAHVCDQCAHRTPVDGPNGHRACQDACGQYQAVPALLDVARRLDPMIASIPQALKNRMPVRGPGVNWAPGRRRKVIRLIQKYLNL